MRFLENVFDIYFSNPRSNDFNCTEHGNEMSPLKSPWIICFFTITPRLLFLLLYMGCNPYAVVASRGSWVTNRIINEKNILENGFFLKKSRQLDYLYLAGPCTPTKRCSPRMIIEQNSFRTTSEPKELDFEEEKAWMSVNDEHFYRTSLYDRIAVNHHFQLLLFSIMYCSWSLSIV